MKTFKETAHGEIDYLIGILQVWNQHIGEEDDLTVIADKLDGLGAQFNFTLEQIRGAVAACREQKRARKRDTEREAVNKLRRILNDLGPQSIVGTTLDGVMDIVESNVDADSPTRLLDSIDLSMRVANRLNDETKCLVEQRLNLVMENELLRKKVWDMEQLMNEMTPGKLVERAVEHRLKQEA